MATSDDTEAPGAAPSFGGVAALAGLYAVALAVYLILAHRQPFPIVNPDEFNYGRLARSVADGDGLTIFGTPISLRGPLYIYTIAPAWLVSSTTSAYTIAKVIGAILVCLTVVPTWLLARQALDARKALVPCVLLLAGTWMTTAAGILTENLALPLTTASLAAMVSALRSPGSRWGWGALALAAIATYARIQCAILIPTLLVALLVRAALERREFLARVRRDRALVAVTSAIVVAGAIVILADRAVLGSYAGVTSIHPSVSRLFSAIGHQSIALVVMTAFIPVIVVLAASLRRAAWADDALAPLLVVTWSATLLLTIQSGWLITGFGAFHVQRYVEYVVPLLLVATMIVLDRGRAVWRDIAITGGVVSIALLLTPGIRNPLEERAAYAVGRRLDELVGISLPVALALASALACAAAIGVLIWAGRAPRGNGPLLGIAGIVLVVLLMQAQTGWQWQIDHARAKRAGFPTDLAWVDHAADGPVAGLVIASASAQWLETSFFNRDVVRLYTPAGLKTPRLSDPRCTWGVDDSGGAHFEADCGPAPRRLLASDQFAHPTFYGQTVVVGNRFVGDLVTVTAAPRLRAVVQVPCAPVIPQPDRTDPAYVPIGRGLCLPAMSGEFWLDSPATLVARFRGGLTPRAVAVSGRRVAIPAGTTTAVRVPIAAGASGVRINLSWTGPSPALVTAVLVQRGRRTKLLGP